MSFYMLCFTLYGAVIKHKEYFSPQSFSFTQVKYKGMYCTGIHLFFLLKIIILIVIIGSFIHLFFYSFSPPLFISFWFKSCEFVYIEFLIKMYIYHKELDVNNFESLRQRMYHIFLFEFNFKESLFTTFHLFIGQ